MIKKYIFCLFFFFGSMVFVSKGMATEGDEKRMEEMIAAQGGRMKKRKEILQNLEKAKNQLDAHKIWKEDCEGQSLLCDQDNHKCNFFQYNAEFKRLSKENKKISDQIVNNQEIYNQMIIIYNELIMLKNTIHQVNKWVVNHNRFGIPEIKNGNCSSVMCLPAQIDPKVANLPHTIPCRLGDYQKQKQDLTTKVAAVRSKIP